MTRRNYIVTQDETGARLDRFPPGMPVVVESSSAVRFLRSVAVVLIVRPPLREMKPSTHAILDRVTDLLINASDRDESAAKAAECLRREYPSLRPQCTWSADLTCEPPRVLLSRLRTLLESNLSHGG